MENKKTALYQFHQLHGAKFIPFAGYDMPLEYSEGTLNEHSTTRNSVGLFDVSHMGQLFVNGKNRLIESLEKIIPSDLSNLEVNKSKYTILLNENGGVVDDLIITRKEEGFYLVVNADRKLIDKNFILRFLHENCSCYLNDELSLISVQGPQAERVLNEIIPNTKFLKFMNGETFYYEGKAIYVTRSGYSGEDGFEISISNNIVQKLVKSLVTKNVKPIGLGARNTLRLESGYCLYGNELNEFINPVEAGLSWVISKNRIKQKNFNGYSTIKLAIDQGPEKVRVGIKPKDGFIAREGTRIFSEDDKEIGFVTSGSYGPTLKESLSMGYVKNEFYKNNMKILLDVRGKKRLGVICLTPFYKRKEL